MANRWDTNRLEAFSDGIIAIAITLLVLEIGVPASGFRDLWKGIGNQWPSYLAYVTSFLTIGGIWLGHHAIFRRLGEADSMVMRLNLLLLMLISFLPFPTRLLAEAITDTAAEREAVIFYGAVLFAISIVVNALWRYIASHRYLLHPDVSEAEVAAITRHTAPDLGFYAAVLVLAIFAPRVAAFGFLVIAVVAVFRGGGDRTTAMSTVE